MAVSISVTKGASNKDQTLPKFSISKTSKKITPLLPQPFIDRIYVTATVPEVGIGVDMYGAIDAALADKAAYAPTRPSKSYSRAVRIAIDGISDAKKRPLYEYACDLSMKMVTRVRIDFVPVDLGPQGMIDLHVALSALMDGGWTFFVRHGNVTRLDVAVDFPDIEMDEFHFLPKQGATTTMWSSNGQLQTFQLGKAKGSHTSIYNRQAKRIAQGKAWQGVKGIRVERRLLQPQIALRDLLSLSNPFSGIGMVKRIPSPPPGVSSTKTYLWTHFLAAAELKGLPAALADLPTHKRTAYRQHLSAHGLGWWNVSELWAEWPTMLSNLRIAETHGWG